MSISRPSRWFVLSIALACGALPGVVGAQPATVDPNEGAPDPTSKIRDPRAIQSASGRQGTTVDPTANPATPATPATPGEQPKPAVHDANATRLLDHLMKEYTGLLGKTKDRLGRSLLLTCMSRVPRPDATAEFLKVLKTDRDAMVQMVAWQCLLARAPGLTDAEYKQWFDATPALVGKGAFRGDLRIALARFLACMPPDKRAREMFGQLFASTNALDPKDAPVLSAMGECVASWKQADVVETLLARFAVHDDAYRAEIILRAAGVGGPGSGVTSVMSRVEEGSQKMWQATMAEYAKAWATEKQSWAGTQRTEGWRTLSPQYIPAVDLSASIDANDKSWYRDLELRAPNLRTFGVGLVLDVTGTMQPAIDWLRSDAKRLMKALNLVALEPQIALTFYRDQGDLFVTKPIPLTSNVDQLVRELGMMQAKGGGDEPEAVREALADTIRVSKWGTAPNTPKSLVLITDAQPKPESVADCEKALAELSTKGFRLHVLKVRTGYEKTEGWANLDKLAVAGAGVAMDVEFTPHSMTGLPTTPGALPPAEVRAQQAAKRPPGASAGSTAGRSDNPAIQPLADDPSRPAGERVVVQIVAGVVNREYAERIRPPVAILWQMLAEPEVERHPVFAAAPPKTSMVNTTTTPMTKKPTEPVDPQKQK